MGGFSRKLSLQQNGVRSAANLPNVLGKSENENRSSANPFKGSFQQILMGGSGKGPNLIKAGESNHYKSIDQRSSAGKATRKKSMGGEGYSPMNKKIKDSSRKSLISLSRKKIPQLATDHSPLRSDEDDDHSFHGPGRGSIPFRAGHIGEESLPTEPNFGGNLSSMIAQVKGLPNITVNEDF